jgi:hypothetical protein
MRIRNIDLFKGNEGVGYNNTGSSPIMETVASLHLCRTDNT